MIQKQPPEVFYKNRCSQKFCQTNSKTPVTESLFQYTYRPQACNFIKKETLEQVFSCKFCKIFKSTFLAEHLQMTASNDNRE